MRHKTIKKYLKKYSIYHIRCTCSGYEAAYLTRSIHHFIKCRSCKRSLGDMDVDFLGHIRAKGEFLAMEEFRKGNYEKNKNLDAKDDFWGGGGL